VWALLFALGAAVGVLGAVVLLRFPDRPGGRVSFLGFDVSSIGAGLPLIVIGVVVMLTAVLSGSRGGTTNTPAASPLNPRLSLPEKAPTVTQSSSPSPPTTPGDASQLPEDDSGPPGPPTYAERQLGGDTHIDLDRGISDTEPTPTDDVDLLKDAFIFRDRSVESTPEAAIVPDEEATSLGCTNASRRISGAISLNDIDINNSLCVWTSEKRWAVVKEVNPDKNAINDSITVNIWLR
jgi:hypothetical protein